MIMRTLHESLLDDIETTMANGASAMNSEFNIDTLPTIKDFEKGPYNNKWHKAIWYCPNVVKKYRSKYPDMIPDSVDSIMIVLDTTYGKVVDCNLFFTTKTTSGISKLKTIVGWNAGFVGANLRKYKQMTIDLLTKLAKNPDKMDELMQYSHEYAKYWEGINSGTAKNTYKYQIKSLTDL